MKLDVDSAIFNPIALRKAKIVCNFGLSECKMVKKRFRLPLGCLWKDQFAKMAAAKECHNHVGKVVKEFAPLGANSYL